MAKLDDLIEQVTDPTLRAELREAVRVLRRRKVFGLVFEEHIPEITLLRDAPLKTGATVFRRQDLSAKEPLSVVAVDRGTARVRNADGRTQDLRSEDLLVLRRFGEPVYPTLTHLGSVERGQGRPFHAVIDGENYHALQLLRFMYEGQIDCIYIDPPYNSGARDWKYNNDFVDRNDRWRHSKWLSMMEKRLRLAKRLLKHDGVLIVTIDENEVHHLGMLLEQLFAECLRYMITIVINPKGTNKANFGRVEEHAFFVVPNLDHEVIAQLPPPVDQRDADLSVDAEDRAGDEEGVWVRELTSGGVQLPTGLRERLGVDGGVVNVEITLGDDGSVVLHPLVEDGEAQDELGEDDVSGGLSDVSVLFLRRRGAESSFRYQRPNQFYAIKVDEERGQVVGVGPPLDEDDSYEIGHREGDVLWVYPIDEEGNERVWRYVRHHAAVHRGWPDSRRPALAGQASGVHAQPLQTARGPTSSATAYHLVANLTRCRHTRHDAYQPAARNAKSLPFP